MQIIANFTLPGRFLLSDFWYEDFWMKSWLTVASEIKFYYHALIDCFGLFHCIFILHRIKISLMPWNISVWQIYTYKKSRKWQIFLYSTIKENGCIKHNLATFERITEQSRLPFFPCLLIRKCLFLRTWMILFSKNKTSETRHRHLIDRDLNTFFSHYTV